MFIYRFSRLIKSKLLWGFLALLMVFAFVVAASCSGTSGPVRVAGYLGDTPVDAATLEDAGQTVDILTGDAAYFLPEPAQVFAALVRGLDGVTPGDWPARRRMNWKVTAAREVGARNGLAAGREAALGVLKTFFVGPGGAFSPTHYRAFLEANQYAKPALFEETFENAWMPAQLATLGVMNAVGWASPMEQDFTLSALYDRTTVYAATLPNTLKPETIAISDKEQEAWHREHQDAYRLPERRDVAYVEIPVAPFAEKIEVGEMDAMQYYDDHSDEFHGTGTNATTVLPFEQVRDKAIAKVKNQRALEEALVYANETLVPKAIAEGFGAATKPYGAAKNTTLRQDRPVGFQNARDLIAAAFEMSVEETPINAVAGTDRVYLFRLEKVLPAQVAPLAEVKARVIADARRDRIEKRIRDNGAAIREKLAAELAKGTAFDKAVAACKVDGLTATTAMTFTLSAASANLAIPHRTEILPAVGTLGTKAVSEPILAADDALVLVYVADRQPGDALAKTTARARLAQSMAFNAAFPITADWLDWNLLRQPPVGPDGKTPIPIEEKAAASEE